jgi:hypothetical protein
VRPVLSDGGGWAGPVVLYRYSEGDSKGVVPLGGPDMVVDSEGAVHVFWAVIQPVEKSAIYYTVLRDGVWSPPVDILIGSNLSQQNTPPAVAIDSQGIIHLIWTNGNLYYTSSHAKIAHSPRAWSPPQMITGRAIGYDIFVDPTNRVHIVFSSLDDGFDVFYVTRPADETLDWASPIAISEVAGTGMATNRPALLVASDGAIHTAWEQDQLPDGWPPKGVYYSHSIDGGVNWSPAIQLAGDNHGAPALGSISESEIHLVWFTTGGTEGRYYSYSQDSGQSWIPARQLSSEIQMLLLGLPYMIKDSNNQLYLLMCGAKDTRNSVFFSEWTGSAWGIPQPITRVAGANEQGMAAAISLGNRINVAWLDITANEVRYTWRLVDALAVESIPIAAPPTVLMTATEVSVSQTTPTVATQPLPSWDEQNVGETVDQGFWRFMVVPIGLVLLILIPVILSRIRRTN